MFTMMNLSATLCNYVIYESKYYIIHNYTTYTCVHCTHTNNNQYAPVNHNIQLYTVVLNSLRNKRYLIKNRFCLKQIKRSSKASEYKTIPVKLCLHRPRVSGYFRWKFQNLGVSPAFQTNIVSAIFFLFLT